MQNPRLNTSVFTLFSPVVTSTIILVWSPAKHTSTKRTNMQFSPFLFGLFVNRPSDSFHWPSNNRFLPVKSSYEVIFTKAQTSNLDSSVCTLLLSHWDQRSQHKTVQQSETVQQAVQLSRTSHRWVPVRAFSDSVYFLKRSLRCSAFISDR